MPRSSSWDEAQKVAKATLNFNGRAVRVCPKCGQEVAEWEEGYVTGRNFLRHYDSARCKKRAAEKKRRAA